MPSGILGSGRQLGDYWGSPRQPLGVQLYMLYVLNMKFYSGYFYLKASFIYVI